MNKYGIVLKLISLNVIKIIFSILFVIYTKKGYCQERSLMMLEKNLPDFYKNMILKNNIHNSNELKCKNISIHIIPWVERDSVYFSKSKNFIYISEIGSDTIMIDNFISTLDFHFYGEQFRHLLNKQFKWENLNSWKLINPKASKNKDIEYWEFSKILFSTDEKKCIIKSSFHDIHGDMERVLFFEKDNKGKWTEKGILKYYESVVK